MSAGESFVFDTGRGKAAFRFAQPSAEAWIRFLVAVLGLGVAFGAALLSTITRDAGNVWATALLAASSLLIAVAVGLITIPYLARRVVAGARWHDVVDFEVTRAGILYVLATLLVGIAALNTGNNLVYIVVAVMLAAIAVSGIASGLVLKDLRVKVLLPEYAFAKEDLRASITISNPRRWVPSLSINVMPAKIKIKKHWRAERAIFSWPANRPESRPWFRFPDLRWRRFEGVAAKPILCATAYFPLIQPGSSVNAAVGLCFESRGSYRQETLHLATRFPFGLLLKRRRIELDRSLIVYPQLLNPGEMRSYLLESAGERVSAQAGQGADLYRIREYLASDSARHIDWKATAKSGAPKTREFSREEDQEILLFFDNPEPGSVDDATYERAVSVAASVAWELNRQSIRVTYFVPDFGSADLHDFLRSLAAVKPEKQTSRPLVVETGALKLIVTTRNPSNLPSDLRIHAQIISVGRK